MNSSYSLRLLSIAVGALLAGALLPMACDAQSGVVRQPLTGVKSAIWTDRVIEVCWENPQAANPAERNWVRDAVHQEWEAHSNLHFVGWNRCTGNSRGIRIGIADDTPHTSSVGSRLDGDRNGMVLNFTFDTWGTNCADGGVAPPGFAGSGYATHREYCIRAIAVHEFGHALGFTHEHNRRHGIPFNCSDQRQGTRGAWLITPYDLDSVMNYCNPDWNGHGRLSPLDIAGLHKVYGAPGQNLNRDPRWYVSFSARDNWVMLNVSKIRLRDLRFADFNGDGRTDVFNSRNDSWYVSYAGTGRWTRINGSRIKLRDLGFGDFNGDGRSDVFNTRNDSWYVSYGGTGGWTRINGSKITLKDLRFGDFNGDGRTDVFNSRDDSWYVSYGGTGGWTRINGSRVKLKDLRFGDFNGDGRTDVFNSRNDSWYVSYGGTGGWTRLNGSRVKLKELRFGDFNGDGRTDVLRTDDRHFYVSWGGTSRWEKVYDTALADNDEIALGDFNGDRVTDVFIRW